MLKVFRVADIRELQRQHMNEEISYSRMVDIMNEMAFNSYYNVCKSDTWVNAQHVLPPVNKRVLCQIKGHDEPYICTLNTSGISNEKKHWRNEKTKLFVHIEDVTHWMDIPIFKSN